MYLNCIIVEISQMFTLNFVYNFYRSRLTQRRKCLYISEIHGARVNGTGPGQTSKLETVKVGQVQIVSHSYYMIMSKVNIQK